MFKKILCPSDSPALQIIEISDKSRDISLLSYHIALFLAKFLQKEKDRKVQCLVLDFSKIDVGAANHKKNSR